YKRISFGRVDSDPPGSAHCCVAPERHGIAGAYQTEPKEITGGTAQCRDAPPTEPRSVRAGHERQRQPHQHHQDPAKPEKRFLWTARLQVRGASDTMPDAAGLEVHSHPVHYRRGENDHPIKPQIWAKHWEPRRVTAAVVRAPSAF